MKASLMQKCKEMQSNEGGRFSNHYPLTRLVYRPLEFVSTLCHILHNNVQLDDNKFCNQKELDYAKYI